MIVFENPGEANLAALTTFGVSVKESEHPVGQFGTGFKYAVAVLLRTGHSVWLQSGTRVRRFQTRREIIRGKEFGVVGVCEQDVAWQPLGFTTDLGRNWRVWMAYRELVCNARDEGGDVVPVVPDLLTPRPGRTLVVVEGREVEQVHARREQWFLDDQPAWKEEYVSVRRRPSSTMFYRGVAVGGMDFPALFTYDVSADLSLTEDRTLAQPWMARHFVARAVVQCRDRTVIRGVVLAERGAWEHGIDLDQPVRPSEEFLDEVRLAQESRAGTMNQTALVVYAKARGAIEPTPRATTAAERAEIARAVYLLARLGFHVTEEVVIVTGLGENILGLARGGRILLSHRAFLAGPRCVLGTVLEEHLHLSYAVDDMTRSMQNLLIDALSYAAERLPDEIFSQPPWPLATALARGNTETEEVPF